MVEFDYRASSLKKLKLSDAADIEYSGHKPQVGDVVAVRIKNVNDTYNELDLEGGELVELEEGDVVLGVLGNRSGVKGYIGEVPEKLDEQDNLSFLGSGGLFGSYVSGAKELDDPCETDFLGYLKNGDNILNTRDFGIESSKEVNVDANLVAVVASRMDAGKTTLASRLIDELSEEYSVGSLKLTGSARERDRLKMLESGSEKSLDFVDAGLPSTVEDSEEVLSAAKGLINEVWSDELDFVVIEFGAGLISNYAVKDVLRDLDIKEDVFAIGGVSLDVMGAYGLKNILDDLEYDLDFISGPITDTTVGRETVENHVGVPALNAFHDEEMKEAVDMISEKFESLS